MRLPIPDGLVGIAFAFEDGHVLTIDAADIQEMEALGAVPGTFASPGQLGPRRIRITFDVYDPAWKETRSARDKIEPPSI